MPVLIAIAPSEAIDYGNTGGNNQNQPPDGLHHKPPQLSTGDGFYITHPDIYCLTFDGKCAPKGPERLNKDSYPSPQPLILNTHDPKSASAPWDWFSLVTGHRHTVLILPMPDPIVMTEFGICDLPALLTQQARATVMTNHTALAFIFITPTALTSSAFRFVRASPASRTARCNPQTRKPRNLRAMARCASSSERLRAQSINQLKVHAYSLHVRMAYKQMFASLLNSSFNSPKAVVEPAEGTVGDDKPVFEGIDQNGVDHGHACFDRDPQNPQNSRPMVPVNISIPVLIAQIGTIVEKLSISPPSGAPLNLQESLLLPEIKDASAGLDPDFPRISQVQRIGELVRLSKTQLDGLDSKFRTNSASQSVKTAGNGTLGDYYRVIRNAEEPVASADPTKNGNDCRAATVVAQ